LCGAPEAAREATKFLHGRYVTRPRLPGFFIPNKARRYAFFYHAEQAPDPASRVTLGDMRDALGMPRLRIDLRYGEIDARSVVASHRVFDENLRAAGIARLDYSVPESEQMASVLEQATDGYHQIGTTRMSDSPAQGIVDRNCRVHGTANLFIAGSSVFPTSGQANPTLLATALAARLAAHIARIVAVLPPLEVAVAQRETALAPP
jgi:choline dehydrogenase-like flavoprotein